MNRLLTTICLMSLLGGLTLAQGAAADLSGSEGAEMSLVGLRLYPAFAEVQQGVEATGPRLKLDLPSSLWTAAVPGTLTLRGLAGASWVQTQDPAWLARWEGRSLILRSGEKNENVTLVRAADLTVKDSAGQFRRVSLDALSFPELPPLNASQRRPVLDVSVMQAGKGTLSYLTRALNWTPRYTLEVADAQATLTALAELNNASDLLLRTDSTELFAGEVQVVGGRVWPADLFGAGSTVEPSSGQLTSGRANAAPVPSPIFSEGTTGGLYRYRIPGSLTLLPRSSLTLPLMKPTLSAFVRVAQLQTSFSVQSTEGTLNRVYRLQAGERLPGGVVSVLEDGQLVGQARMGETAEGREVVLMLGADPNVLYTRSVEIQTTQRGLLGGTSRTYRVTYTLRNASAQTIRAEVNEAVYGNGRPEIVLNGKTVTQGTVATLPFVLTPGSSQSQSFTVELPQ